MVEKQVPQTLTPLASQEHWRTKPGQFCCPCSPLLPPSLPHMCLGRACLSPLRAHLPPALISEDARACSHVFPSSFFLPRGQCTSWKVLSATCLHPSLGRGTRGVDRCGLAAKFSYGALAHHSSSVILSKTSWHLAKSKVQIWARVIGRLGCLPCLQPNPDKCQFYSWHPI